MDTFEFPTTAAALGRFFGAVLVGDGEAPVQKLAALERAGSGTLSFLASRKYSAFLPKAHGAVLFTNEALAEPGLPVTYLLVADPQAAFAQVARQFSPKRQWHGISPQAIVHPSAVLGEDVHIGPFTIISENVHIGTGTYIHSHAYFGAGVTIGEHCEIHPQAVLWDRVQIGNRVKIFTGAVIGSDGFGYFEQAASHHEMPQVGTVVIEDDVRIGARCTIDRATLGETWIGRGSKLDDQVHIAHNVRVGPNALLCAQVGIAGSSVIEADCILAGQVGIGHGVTIGKGARLGGQCGSTTNLKGGETYFLTPATPMSETVKVVRYTRKLPQIWERLKRLEERLGKE